MTITETLRCRENWCRLWADAAASRLALQQLLVGRIAFSLQGGDSLTRGLFRNCVLLWVADRAGGVHGRWRPKRVLAERGSFAGTRGEPRQRCSSNSVLETAETKA